MRDLRQEPYAVTLHVRICAGGGQQWPSLTRPNCELQLREFREYCARRGWEIDHLWSWHDRSAVRLVRANIKAEPANLSANPPELGRCPDRSGKLSGGSTRFS
jgi:hypothetical protein